MGDSDDEYDRRRRDKFRGERNEYRGTGESGRREERGNARREEWTERYKFYFYFGFNIK